MPPRIPFSITPRQWANGPSHFLLHNRTGWYEDSGCVPLSKLVPTFFGLLVVKLLIIQGIARSGWHLFGAVRRMVEVIEWSKSGVAKRINPDTNSGPFGARRSIEAKFPKCLEPHLAGSTGAAARVARMNPKASGRLDQLYRYTLSSP